MAPLRVGFFVELRHGDHDGPSLRSAIRRDAQPDEDALGAYLDAGKILATTGRLVDDVLDPTRVGIAPLDIRTVGERVWPGDLAYYVRVHHAVLPTDLIDRARSLSFVPPRIDDAELMEIVRHVREG